jgi:hypothetical protein
MMSKKQDKYGSWKEGKNIKKKESPKCSQTTCHQEAIKAIQVNVLYNRNRKRKIVNHTL